jgi:integrase
MAVLEYIHFSPAREVIDDGVVTWVRDKLARSVVNLPQIFWSGGGAWAEANLWALEKVNSTHGAHIKTATSLMKHLTAYADWLESEQVDWRHFPERRSDRVLVRYRNVLITKRDDGELSPSTATARMAAVIQFYRFTHAQGLVCRDPLWRDRTVVVRYHDSVGFKRTITRLTSELSIPNRARLGLILEDGLTPLRGEQTHELLSFAIAEKLQEMHLMLCLGFFTGARIGTITTLRVSNVENATPDPQMPGFYLVPVGPGTGVDTKFGVSGDLLVPDIVMDELREYAYSMGRLRRQALALEENRSLLFLTTRGNRYLPQSFNRLMTDLRRRAMQKRLRFMGNFKFHQTRCTYGTWLMELALRVTTEAGAIAFVRDAMLHKDERVTLRYVRFHEQSGVKAAISNEFSSMFTGVVNRDWNDHSA